MFPKDETRGFNARAYMTEVVFFNPIAVACGFMGFGISWKFDGDLYSYGNSNGDGS